MAETNAVGETTHGSALRYVGVWLALLVLTAATYLLSRVGMGAFAFPVAMAIALGKASLVVLFFMHLIEQRGVNAMVLLLSLLFVALLIGLALADVATRFPLANPQG